MAFGKKKKEKKNQPQAIVKYNKNNNPLYPEKVENDVKALLWQSEQSSWQSFWLV